MNRSYHCYHGNQYTFLNHILPTNQYVNPPINRRPTIKGNDGCISQRHERRDIKFIDSHENMINNRIFDTTTATGPYQIYSSAIDVESSLRSLDNKNTKDTVQRIPRDSELFVGHLNLPENNETKKYYNTQIANTFKDDPMKDFGCTMEEKYDLVSNNRIFNNPTKNAVYNQQNYRD
jgi:hypothetical protein